MKFRAIMLIAIIALSACGGAEKEGKTFWEYNCEFQLDNMEDALRVIKTSNSAYEIRQADIRFELSKEAYERADCPE
jgi:hypothetical protein